MRVYECAIFCVGCSGWLFGWMDMGVLSEGDSVWILFCEWAGVCVCLDYIVHLFFESWVLLGGNFFFLIWIQSFNSLLIWINFFHPNFLLLKTPDVFFDNVILECNWASHFVIELDITCTRRNNTDSSLDFLSKRVIFAEFRCFKNVFANNKFWLGT